MIHLHLPLNVRLTKTDLGEGYTVTLPNGAEEWYRRIWEIQARVRGWTPPELSRIKGDRMIEVETAISALICAVHGSSPHSSGVGIARQELLRAIGEEIKRTLAPDATFGAVHPDAPAMAKAAYRMKKDIESAAASAIGQFQVKTGLTPNDIQIRLADRTPMGSPVKVFVVASVEIQVSI